MEALSLRKSLLVSSPHPLPPLPNLSCAPCCKTITRARDPCQDAELAVLNHPYLPLHPATAVVVLTGAYLSDMHWYRVHIQALERSARGAEGECEAAVKRRVDIAVQQVAVWQAAAQASAQLQSAQEHKAAKAARHSQKVTAMLGSRVGGGEGAV